MQKNSTICRVDQQLVSSIYGFPIQLITNIAQMLSLSLSHSLSLPFCGCGSTERSHESNRSVDCVQRPLALLFASPAVEVEIMQSFLSFFSSALSLSRSGSNNTNVSVLRVSELLFNFSCYFCLGDLSMRERKFIVAFQRHAYNSICLQMFAQLNLFVSQFEYCRFLRFILIVSACTLPFVFVVYFVASSLSPSFFDFYLLVCVFFSSLARCFVFIFVLRFLTYSICHNLLSDFSVSFH